ncbi:MAG: hypothetical protein QOD66_1502 [Solirubrobacteraceae bacterium]|nr:hypothetical protein [Solirubrobacteraceae bacterium]
MTQLTLTLAGTGDYSSGRPVAGDNAGPAIDALIHGHISTFVSHQPLMGLTSLLLRAPFTGAAQLLGGGSRLAYGLGALACLLPLVLLAAWMVGQANTAQRRCASIIAAGVVLVGPATVEAVNIGHPEEVLAATLATIAVLAAVRGRTGWAWVMLGLAVGTKQWALLAAPCVALALPEHRLATMVKAGVLALALSATLPLADPAAFASADSVVGGIGFADPYSLWWPVGPSLAIPAHAAFAPTAHLLPFGLTRSVAAAFGLVIALGAVWVYWSRGGRSSRLEPLALLALCGLVRCVTDPDPLQYNFVALLIPLAAWEAVELRRMPLATALATGATALLAGGSVALNAGGGALTPAVLSALSIAWTLILGCYLARRAVGAHGQREVGEFSPIAAAAIRQGA